MTQTLAANWPLAAIGAAVALVLLWWVILASRRTRVKVDRRDTLDEGAARAARNQALIDAPAAISRGEPGTIAPAAPETVAGAGIAIAAAAEHVQGQAHAPGVNELTQIKGLGPRLATVLQDLGVVSLAQIAAWDEAEIDRIDARLGRFEGRIRRDRWVEQARLLIADDRAAYNAAFGAH